MTLTPETDVPRRVDIDGHVPLRAVLRFGLVALALLLAAGLSRLPGSGSIADRPLSAGTAVRATVAGGAPSLERFAVPVAAEVEDPIDEPCPAEPGASVPPPIPAIGVRPTAAATLPVQAHLPPDRPPRSV